MRELIMAVLLCVGCSASQVHTQALVASGVGMAGNHALSIAGRVYEQQATTVIVESCGHVQPCPDPLAALEALDVLNKQWRPVWDAFEVVSVAQNTWADALDKCQDAGAEKCEAAPDVDKAVHELRCVLKHVAHIDPFEGSVSCE